MKIKDFLMNFDGNNYIEIYDLSNFNTHKFNLVYNAITDYGHYKIKKWFIDENILKITIQSQF